MDEFNRMHKTVGKIFGWEHTSVLRIKQSIDEAHEKKNQSTDPQILSAQLQASIGRREYSIVCWHDEIADLRGQREKLDKKITDSLTKLQQDEQTLASLQAQLEKVQAPSREAVPIERLEQLTGPGVKQWLDIRYPGGWDTSESLGTRSIPEHLANEYLEWDKHVHILSKFKRHAATRKDSEVAREDIEQVVYALQIVWAGDKPCIPELSKDVEEIFREAGTDSRGQIRVLLLAK